MLARQVAHLVRLLDDLLDVSRITSGQLRLETKPVTLQSILSLAMDSHRQGIAQKGIEFSEQLADVGRRLVVDESRMAQVISNLLGNAVKFSKSGGRITLQGAFFDPPQVEASFLELALRDDGAGIAANDLPHIFDMFASTSQYAAGVTLREGLGVGLALARRIVQLHGGTLEAHSEGPSCGAEFVLRIPVVHASTGSPSDSQEEARSPENLRVLVVDDNVDGADAMVLLLDSMGYQASAQYDGTSAIAATQQQCPAIVLLDIGMPGMNGFETCRRLRQIHGRTVKIVAVTGWGQDEDKRRALRSGFDAHLTKPAGPDELLAVFSEVAGRAASSH
jgi:CheY-like chemotaxis protein